MYELTVSASALGRLLDAYPNPDDAGPVGPWGPVIRFGDLVSLNPQPLPPGPGDPFARAVREWGPHPRPALAAGVARALVSAHLDRFTQAGIIIVSGDTERAAELSARAIAADVDIFCGTQPYRGPFPRPWGPLFDSSVVHGADLVAAGLEYQRATDAFTDHVLAGALQEAASRLLDEGFRRLGEASTG